MTEFMLMAGNASTKGGNQEWKNGAISQPISGVELAENSNNTQQHEKNDE